MWQPNTFVRVEDRWLAIDRELRVVSVRLTINTETIEADLDLAEPSAYLPDPAQPAAATPEPSGSRFHAESEARASAFERQLREMGWSWTRATSAGEVMLHDDQGQVVHLGQDGVAIRTDRPVTVAGARVTVTASDRLDLQAPQIRLQASLGIDLAGGAYVRSTPPVNKEPAAPGGSTRHCASVIGRCAARPGRGSPLRDRWR